MTTTQDSYGLVGGGYRVTFTNWNGNGRETFFQNKSDASEYLAKYTAYGYKGIIDPIFLHVKEAN
jgi:hypothetical protein